MKLLLPSKSYFLSSVLRYCFIPNACI